MSTNMITHSFIRINGELFEVQPMTYANAENPSVKVRVLRTGQVRRVDATAIILSH